ncbi:hypothetical protein [Alicyclobacillus cycloheptanicus]|uniref:Photosystem II stability/assembly factor-like uncharacterized protein n=1 Tax=Alicyclobacillus cycloheptanicus TaxID=1457 RepID=A0ABT9XLT5_9BACL|nr:hypothetical protein [Alicyclobacillus cycloheptanicus]MDQ0191271.1 photosystem II stability/assembly factor-like uncharacterized protein [Alicyclobacillus cycloheptanicus]
MGSKSGITYKTTDGGATWTAVFTASEPIVGLQATGAQGQFFVVAWTKNYMLTDMAGEEFSKVLFNGTSSVGFAPTPMEDVSLVPSDYQGNDFLVFVSTGVVWSSNGGGASWLKRTPPVPVASVAAVDPSTWYAAATTGAIYRTTDGGQHWTKVYSTSLDQTQEWNVATQASGNHVAVLYTCNGGAMNQRPYILFESNDAGQTWNTLFDESMFESLYGNAKPALDDTPPAAQPGPFAVLSNGNVLFIGAYPANTMVTTVSVITPKGIRIVYDPVGGSSSAPSPFDFPVSPVSLSAPDDSHFFLAGGNNGKGVFEESTDGGLTWQSN